MTSTQGERQPGAAAQVRAIAAEFLACADVFEPVPATGSAVKGSEK